jgi:hypothetical protein
MRKVVDKKITYVNALTSTAADKGLAAAQGKALKDLVDTKQAALTFGIANTNALQVDSASVADDEFARFTTSGLKSLSETEMKTALGIGAFFTASFSRTSDNEIFTDSSGGFLTAFKWIASENQFQFKSNVSYQTINCTELFPVNGDTTTSSSFTVYRRGSAINQSSSYQYLTGGSSANSSLVMGVGNILKVRICDQTASTYFYDIEAYRSGSVVVLQIEKKGNV